MSNVENVGFSWYVWINLILTVGVTLWGLWTCWRFCWRVHKIYGWFGSGTLLRFLSFPDYYHENFLLRGLNKSRFHYRCLIFIITIISCLLSLPYCIYQVTFFDNPVELASNGNFFPKDPFFLSVEGDGSIINRVQTVANFLFQIVLMMFIYHLMDIFSRDSTNWSYLPRIFFILEIYYLILYFVELIIVCTDPTFVSKPTTETVSFVLMSVYMVSVAAVICYAGFSLFMSIRYMVGQNNISHRCFCIPPEFLKSFILILITVIIFLVQIVILWLLELEQSNVDDDDNLVENTPNSVIMRLFAYSMSLPRFVFTLLLILCSKEPPQEAGITDELLERYSQRFSQYRHSNASLSIKSKPSSNSTSSVDLSSDIRASNRLSLTPYEIGLLDTNENIAKAFLVSSPKTKRGVSFGGTELGKPGTPGTPGNDDVYVSF